ncbi:RNA polymerase Rpc34 subunit-domain-containing protein [Flagelloscypha sp. PMI_526]|nr:RNA polymerase Rpc34 subunit-domain-containing protein [Flagelloscypha sp. PMI_526]
MSSRKPTKEEVEIHKAALRSPKQELSVEALAAIVPDVKERTSAVNFLVSVGLFTALSIGERVVAYRGVTKEEFEATKNLALTAHETSVLTYIKQANDEGIWTKHIKTKTGLHQTLVDRALKSLTSKKIIKQIKSVQHPTRKIYMLETLTPSISLTGGPWYTDGEFDVEFIQTLTKTCLRFIQDMTFPKQTEAGQTKFFPPSHSPNYPSADTLRKQLKASRLTTTDLTVEHVETLLNVLVLDGEIERVSEFSEYHAVLPSYYKIPSYGGFQASSQINEDEEGLDERPVKSKSHKKRRHQGDSDDSDEPTIKRRKKRDLSDSESDSARPSRSERKKRRKSRASTDSEDDGQTSSKKSRKSSRRHDSSDDAESDSELEDSRRRSKSRSTARESFSYDILTSFDTSSWGWIQGVSLGWSQAPCGHCPSLEFCKDGGLDPKASGPVNPRECGYFFDLLNGTTVASLDVEA